MYLYSRLHGEHCQHLQWTPARSAPVQLEEDEARLRMFRAGLHALLAVPKARSADEGNSTTTSESTTSEQATTAAKASTTTTTRSVTTAKPVTTARPVTTAKLTTTSKSPKAATTRPATTAAPATTSQRKVTAPATTTSTTQPTTTRHVPFETVTTARPHAAMIKHPSAIRLPSHAEHDEQRSVHITGHVDVDKHAEPVQEAEPWSVSTGVTPESEHDVVHVDEPEHVDVQPIPDDASWQNHLPDVHISVEPPPPGSAPVSLPGVMHGLEDHPVPLLVPGTPPLSQQAMKDSSFAGVEAADAAMQMGPYSALRLESC